MSRQMPEHLCAGWLLWAEGRQLRVLRRVGRRAAAGYVEHDVLDALPSSVADDASNARTGIPASAWLDATRRACASIGKRWPLDVTLALPQSATPALPVEFAAERMPDAVRSAYLKARFEQVFGNAAGGWHVQCDRRVLEGRAIAYACDAALVDGVTALRAGAARLRITPAVTWGAQRAMQALQPQRNAQQGIRGWYVHREADRDVALWLADGRASHIALLPRTDQASQRGAFADGDKLPQPPDTTALTTQLADWAARLGMDGPADALVVASADAQPRSWWDTRPGHTVHIGLFGRLDARPAG